MEITPIFRRGLGRLIDFFTGGQVSANPSRVKLRPIGVGLEQKSSDESDPLADVPRYPPFDSGIPAMDPALIVSTQNELIRRIRRAAGLSEIDFQRLIVPAIENLAAHVCLLPATSNSHHRNTGGLFRFCLDVGLHSLNAANTTSFPEAGNNQRRYLLLPKWGIATLFAGLCSPLYRTMSSMIVLSEAGAQWEPIVQSLDEWRREKEVKRYFIRWTEEPATIGTKDTLSGGRSAASAFMVNQIIPPFAIEYLREQNTEILPCMLSAIAGETSDRNPIAKLVSATAARVIEQDLKRSDIYFGHFEIGVQVAPNLVDVLRRVIRRGEWQPNLEGSALLIGKEGVFLEWERASGTIVTTMRADRFTAFPQDPDTLAEVLVRVGVLEASPKGGRYWDVVTPSSGEIIGTCVKVRDSSLVLPEGLDVSGFQNVSLILQSGGRTRRSRSPAEEPPQLTLGLPNDAPPSDTELPPMGDGRLPPQPDPSETPDGANQSASDSVSASDDGADQKRPATKSSRKTSRSRAENPPEPPAPEPEPDAEVIKDTPSIDSNPPPKGQKNAKPQSPGQGAATLLERLPEAYRDLIVAVRTNYQTNAGAGIVGYVPNGFAISLPEINSHGQSAFPLLESLYNLNWLYVDETRPTTKLHSLPGHPGRHLILKAEVAAVLGFEER